MGWTSDEPKVVKKEMDTAPKVLLMLIIFVALLIIAIIIILLKVKMEAVILSVNNKVVNDYDTTKLVTDIDSVTYINIEEFSKLVRYEYHKGEYKSFSNEEDKCYVIGKEETATFYLNDNKVNKLPVDKQFEEKYREHLVQNSIKIKNGSMYAPIDAISIAFNVKVVISKNAVQINTLDNLVKLDNNNLVKWGYTDISEQSFENHKALLYDRLIVKKEDGLYKIINRTNTKEIVPDKYEEIEFVESAQQFLVTNILGKVGIIDIDGKIEIEPIYDSLTILEDEEKLYIAQKDTKYGIIKADNTEVVKFKYDSIGCDMTSVELGGKTKVVTPVTTINECNGIVVKKNEKYGVIDIKENIIVPIEVDSIYSLKNENDKNEYFMIYNGEELNIIKMLIEQGIIPDSEKEKEKEEKQKHNIENTVVTTNETVEPVSNNTITNTNK